jgi:hypothetical protein
MSALLASALAPPLPLDSLPPVPDSLPPVPLTPPVPALPPLPLSPPEALPPVPSLLPPLPALLPPLPALLPPVLEPLLPPLPVVFNDVLSIAAGTQAPANPCAVISAITNNVERDTGCFMAPEHNQSALDMKSLSAGLSSLLRTAQLKQ